MGWSSRQFLRIRRSHSNGFWRLWDNRLYVVIALILLAGILSFHNWMIRKQTHNIARVQETAIHTPTDHFETRLHLLQAEAAILADLPSITRLVNHKFEADNEAYLEIESIFCDFMHHAEVYDQIRLIDAQGMERIRIDYVNGATPTPAARLQNKLHRPYFQHGLELKPGQLYLSELDLNIENGEIEIPYKPMLRMVIAIEHNEGQIGGLLVLNILAESLLREVERSGHSTEHRLGLVNNDGYWLISHNPDNTWGHIIPERQDRNMKQMYPSSWDQKSDEPISMTLNSEGMFTFAKIYPEHTHAKASTIDLVHNNSGKWIVVSHIPQTELPKFLDWPMLWLSAGWLLVTGLGLYLVDDRRRAAILKQHHDQQLATSEARFTMAEDASNDGIFDWDLHNDEVHYSDKLHQMLGLRPGTMSSDIDALADRIPMSRQTQFITDLASITHGHEDRMHTNLLMTHASGEERWMMLRAIVRHQSEGHQSRLVGTLTDITEMRNTQDKLKKMIDEDALTGLSNRNALTQLIRQAKQRHRRSGEDAAILFFDFDRFKSINDSLGHNVGDELLRSIARRLETIVGDQGDCARFGGDEFAVLLTDVTPESCDAMVQRLLVELIEPHNLESHKIISKASIGVVASLDGYQDAETWMRDADTAMYRAKSTGRARACTFDAAMRAETTEKLELEQALEKADLDAEFSVLYQPILDVVTSEIVSFEALLRWNPPGQKAISPQLFIPIAEECGAIKRLGLWVLQQALDQLASWQNDPAFDGIDLHVNVSRRELMSQNYVEQFMEILSQHCVPADRLVIEVTETAMFDDRSDALLVVDALRALGVKVAIDDFGTGHSTMACLHDLPADIIKVDRAFLMATEKRLAYAAVLGSIVSLAQTLDLQVVAEGVETQDQLALLQSLDCNYAQGYFFSKPITAEEATQMIKRGNNHDQAAVAA